MIKEIKWVELNEVLINKVRNINSYFIFSTSPPTYFFPTFPPTFLYPHRLQTADLLNSWIWRPQQ